MAIIGIDLGTTNSLCAAWRGGECVLVPNAFGSLLTPSVVGVGDEGDIITGQVAQNRLVTHPDKTAAVFKQFMGTDKAYTLGGHTLRPAELSAMVLRSLKKDAEAFLGEEVSEAIVSVPAYFNDVQRSATKAAGAMAGLKVERILNEPSAAALAYRQAAGSDGISMVVDFGGGTLDVSILDSFANIVDILAVSGDNHLGGSDIDDAILAAFLQAHPALQGRLLPGQLAVLRRTAEQCKISLSAQPLAMMVYRHEGQEYALTLDKATLTEILAPVMQRLREVLQQALRGAGMPVRQVERVLLVGGSCRMPLVREYIEYITGQPPHCEVNPDHAVALGVGAAAGIKERGEGIRDMILTDICPFTLGVGVAPRGEGEMLLSPIIPRGTSLPASRERRYTTTADNQTEILVQVFQGEGYYAKENLQVAQLTIQVPPMPRGEPCVITRLSYDINGILEVDVRCEETNRHEHTVVLRGAALTDADVENSRKTLERLKASPLERDENALLLARARRVFAESYGPVRELLQYRIVGFEQALLGGEGPAGAARRGAALNALLAQLEQQADGLLADGAPQEESAKGEETP